MTVKQLEVTSHVSRDLLQNAAYFNTFGKIVWEYVSNSLDAAKDNGFSIVDVMIDKRSITISDNGRGMSRVELMTFFQMHGENIQRRRGKRVRGRFGTGKSAAFGLAKTLIIETTQDGTRNSVKLSRKQITSASDGKPIPVKDIAIDERTSAPDGTVVKIENFLRGKRPRIEKVVQLVERHLSRYRGRAEVRINGNLCKPKEIEYRKLIECNPPAHVSQHICQTPLIIKVSHVPLEEERVGIDILSHGIWHETTLVGIKDKERSKFIFGEIDVPVLEDGDWDIPAFDNTRSVKLNDQNPVVSILLGWISQELEQVRQKLVQEEQERRKSQQARKLKKEAKRIAKVLNEDFTQQEMELENARRARASAGMKLVNEEPGGGDGLTPGDGDIPGDTQEAGNPHGNGNRGTNASEGDTPRPGPSLMEGNDLGSPKRIEQGKRKRRRAVFNLEYENGSPTLPRSRYDGADKTIYINLEHPQVANALQASKGRTESKHFREISYEVAAIEYALALQYEIIAERDAYDAFAALDELRNTITRITSKIAQALYN